MSYNLTQTSQSLADQINKTPVIILEIEGSQYVYGSGKILELAKWDDPRTQWDNTEGITWDGTIEKDNSRPYIDLKKSTQSVSQQLIVEKGGAGSVASMTIALVDYRGEVAEDLSFNQIGEPLGKKANVYATLEGGVHPTDSQSIIRGYINDISYEAGLIKVSITHPSNETRNPLYESMETNTTLAIDDTVTTIPVEITEPFSETQDILTSYIRIEDEYMEVISKTSNSFEVIRGRFGTLAVSHDTDTEVISAYQLEGLPIEIALKLLLSKNGNNFKLTDVKVKSINYIDNTLSINGAVIVDNADVENYLGLVPGDFIELSGTASNDGIYTVDSFGLTGVGQSYIRVVGSLTEELALDSGLGIKSKYNTLPQGVGLDLDQVDVAQFEDLSQLFSSSFIQNDFLLTETMDSVKEFIESQLFFPAGLYYLPKGSKISGKFNTPPFSVETIPTLNTKTITKMSNIISKRALHKYFYNVVVYQYNPDPVENKSRDKIILISESSFNRVDRGVHKQTIKANGLDRSNEVLQILESTGQKYLTRYRFGARYIENVIPIYSIGLRLQCGDVVFFGGEDTQLVNLETGARDLPLAQYEVVNLDHNYFTGTVKVSLLETGFGFDGIFGVYSPSSLVSEGSTASRLLLTDRILDTSQTDRETEKWDNKLGLKVRILSQDYTRDETTTLDSIDPTNINAVLLDPPLSFTPQVGDVMELAQYPEYGDSDEETGLKLRFTWTMPSVLITNVISNDIFDVENVDGLEVGMSINVHSDDYTRDSERRIIDEINGLELTLDSVLDITPQINDRLEVYSYADAKGYRFL